MNWRVLLLRHYAGDGGASLCDVGHEPAVARIQADEVVGPRPVEAHGELPAKCELDDGGIECLDEGLPGFLVVVVGQCKFGLEHVPEVIDVVLAATFVVGEGIEGRVEVVEHGDALEVRGLICLNVEHLAMPAMIFCRFASVMPLLKRPKTVNGSMSCSSSASSLGRLIPIDS